MVDKTTNHHRGFGFITLKDPNKVLEVLLNQPHIINSKQIDCKYAIPKELLSAVDTTATTSPDTNAQDGSNSRSNKNSPNDHPKKKKKKQKLTTPVSSSEDKGTPPICINTQYNSKNSITVDNKDTPLHLRKMFIGGLPTNIPIDAFVSYFCNFGPVDKGIIMTDKNTGRSRGFGFIVFANETTLNTVLNMGRYHYVCKNWIECKRALPKDQVKRANESTALASEELFVYQQQFPHNNSKHMQPQQQQQAQMFMESSGNIEDKEIQEQPHNKGRLFENYFNNCILNPVTNNNYSHHTTLLDSNGNDVSELKLYENAHKIKLFPETMDSPYTHPLTTTTHSHDTGNSNINDASTVDFQDCFGPNYASTVDFQDCFGPNKDTMRGQQSNLNENFKPY